MNIRMVGRQVLGRTGIYTIALFGRTRACAKENTRVRSDHSTAIDSRQRAVQTLEFIF